MFKPGRWRGEKNKIKALFKLQFHATQVTDIAANELVLSIVPHEQGKPELRSEKAMIKDGVCKWKNPIFESVTFIREPRTKKISQKIYHFIVSTSGSARGSTIGKVSIDLADYADEAAKPFMVSLPLRSSSSNSNGVLHVSILRVQGNGNQRETGDIEDTNIKMYDDGNFKPRLSNAGDDTVERFTKTDPNGRSYVQVIDGASSRSLSTSESGSEQDPTSFVSLMSYTSSVPRETTTSAPQPHWKWSFDQNPKKEIPEIERLKAELAAMSRKVDLSELELQTLRKQIAKCRDSDTVLEEEVRFEKALEELVNGDSSSSTKELEICKREKEELEMQMEQMALEFEIMKQENHEVLCRLEQRELEEELKPMEIEEMEDRVLEFEADLEEITRSKVGEEKRAIRAEAALRKVRSENRKTAVKLHEEFGKLTKQIEAKLLEMEAKDGLEMEVKKLRAECDELRRLNSEHQERNRSMEEKLKGLQERYSEMSLKFAEVEGERQQHVITLRNLKKNTKI